MPIYEYVCSSCNAQVELLVRGSQAPVCSACGSGELERLLSLPAIKSASTTAKGLAAAKRRDQKQATERTQEQLRYERSHND